MIIQSTSQIVGRSITIVPTQLPSEFCPPLTAMWWKSHWKCRYFCFPCPERLSRLYYSKLAGDSKEVHHWCYWRAGQPGDRKFDIDGPTIDSVPWKFPWLEFSFTLLLNPEEIEGLGQAVQFSSLIGRSGTVIQKWHGLLQLRKKKWHGFFSFSRQAKWKFQSSRQNVTSMCIIDSHTYCSRRPHLTPGPPRSTVCEESALILER